MFHVKHYTTIKKGNDTMITNINTLLRYLSDNNYFICEYTIKNDIPCDNLIGFIDENDFYCELFLIGDTVYYKKQ